MGDVYGESVKNLLVIQIIDSISRQWLESHGGNIMKAISVRDLQKKIRESVDAAQKDRVVVTRNGKPAALLIGVEGQDWESVVIQTSGPFWELIKKRRKEKTISIKEMRKRVRS